MIISPQYIVYPLLLLDNSLFSHKELLTQSYNYVPYTTSYMMEYKNDIFLEKFWNSLIKEDFEK